MKNDNYKAKDKIVQKMSKEGLTEENLHDHTKKLVHHSEPELPRIRSPEFQLEREKNSLKLDISDRGTSKRNKKYQLRKEDEQEAEPQEGEAFFRGEKELTRKRQRRITVDEGREREGMEAEESTSRSSSLRMEFLHEHSNRISEPEKEESADEKRNRKKMQVQSRGRLHETSAEPEESAVADLKEELSKKAKKERLNQEQRKRTGRLSFEDEGSEMVRGFGTGIGRKAVTGVTMAASAYAHGKIHDSEDENAGVESVHKSELLAEQAARSLKHAQERRKKSSSYTKQLKDRQETGTPKSRLHFGSSESGKEAEGMAGKAAAETEQAKKSAILRFWQKKRYQRAYAASKEGKKVAESAKAVQSVTVKARKVAQEVLKRNSGLLIGIGVFLLLFALAGTSLSSCSAFIQGGGTTIVGTTYVSTDEDIYAVENAYKALETELQAQIDRMEREESGYDEYRYQIDEIGHNPYHLISYFTAKYGEFTYEQVADEVEEIFRAQYHLETQSQQETVTETKTVRVGESLGEVVTSGYCNCTICCGQWSGGPTASGVYPTPNHTIAVDAANPFVPMGTHIVMNGVEYVVEDTGNFARYGVQFDVYYGDHQSASSHGHKTWEAYIADSNGAQKVEVTVTREVDRLNVSMTNHNLDTVLRNRMNADEKGRYDLYNHTYGNRDYLFDVNTPSYGGGFGYEIPAEALSDEKFARMIAEAEKYLGYPYVWGGASPSTSFDCSGFVCWVINNCGNGWNVGRTTADGLRGACAQVSPSEAKPGDIIFFQGTYNTAGASHVGIYVGDGMMIHCGNPIQYTSIESPYWQQHFMAFGRLP